MPDSRRPAKRAAPAKGASRNLFRFSTAPPQVLDVLLLDHRGKQQAIAAARVVGARSVSFVSDPVFRPSQCLVDSHLIDRLKFPVL
jgi:hypothetical protein